jgi:hypothetical protein
VRFIGALGELVAVGLTELAYAATALHHRRRVQDRSAVSD